MSILLELREDRSLDRVKNSPLHIHISFKFSEIPPKLMKIKNFVLGIFMLLNETGDGNLEGAFL